VVIPLVKRYFKDRVIYEGVGVPRLHQSADQVASLNRVCRFSITFSALTAHSSLVCHSFSTSMSPHLHHPVGQRRTTKGRCRLLLVVRRSHGFIQ